MAKIFYLYDPNSGENIKVEANSEDEAIKYANRRFAGANFKVKKIIIKDSQSIKFVDFLNRVLVKMQDGTKVSSFTKLKELARQLKATYKNSSAAPLYYWQKSGANWIYKIWEDDGKYYCNFNY